MRRGGTILILLGLILGLVTAGATFLTLTQNQPQAQQIATRPIVIAMQSIPGRTEIPAQALGLQPWPEASIPVGAFDKIEDAAGKLTLQPIYQGQIVLAPMIIDKTQAKETRSNASYLIPEGKIAVSFSASGVNAVAGAIQVGDTVDIMLTLSPGGLGQATGTTRTTTAVTTTTGTEGQAVTQLMLQDVPIIQVGSWNTPSDKPAPGDSLTVVLDRQDALALKSALEQGSFQLILRRVGDHKPATTEPVTLQYLNKRFNFNLTAPGQR